MECSGNYALRRVDTRRNEVGLHKDWMGFLVQDLTMLSSKVGRVME